METGKKMQGRQEKFSAAESERVLGETGSRLLAVERSRTEFLWSGDKLLTQFSRAIDFYLCQDCSSRFALQETENLQRFPIGHSLDALSSLLCRHTFIHLDELP